MNVFNIKLLGAFLFYVIMFFIYRYASGRYQKPKGRDKYIAWVNTEGKKVRKSVIILTILFTLAQIIIIVS